MTQFCPAWDGVRIGLPDERCRRAILDKELKEAGYTGTVPANASNLMQGMSGRDISMLAQRLAAKGESGDFLALIARSGPLQTPSLTLWLRGTGS